MNLQSPFATEDWRRGLLQKQIDFLDVAAECSDGDVAAECSDNDVAAAAVSDGDGGGGVGGDDSDVGLRVSASGMQPW